VEANAGGGQVPLEVSRRIKKEFENGHDYYALHGREVNCPESAAARPDAAVLTWYNEKRYLG
jgi:hypothetical protein